MRLLNPFNVEQLDLRQTCAQSRNSLYGLRGIRVGEASNPSSSTDQWREVSSDDEPLLAPTQPPIQPVSGTLRVDSGRSHATASGRNLRPRLGVQPVSKAIVEDPDPSVLSRVLASSRVSVSPTILDALEEDLEVSVSSTVPASSRALRRLRLVSGRACDEPTVPMGPDAVVHVIADPGSEVLSDTATDPDLGARVDHEEKSDRDSSGDDSVVDDREAHEAVGDVFVPNTVWTN